MSTSTIIKLPNGSFVVKHPNGQQTFVPPLTLQPNPPMAAFIPPPGHGYVAATGKRGRDLPSFSWNNMKDVKTKRFKSGTRLPKQIINSPPDQGNCGSCWLVSAVSMTGDRLAINTLTVPQPLDALDFCCGGGDGCQGGYGLQAFQMIQSSGGIGLDSCNPYNKWCGAGWHCQYEGSGVSAMKHRVSETVSNAACKCSQVTINQKCPVVAKVLDYKSFGGDINQIKDEIFQNGPVVVGFMATDVLIKNYNCTKNNPVPFDGSGNGLGGHAVVIVGWGKDYWVVRNSWGPKWNGTGFWNYKFGCGLENGGSMPVAGWTVIPANTHLLLKSSPNPPVFTQLFIAIWVIGGVLLVLLLLFLLKRRRNVT